MTTIPTLPTRRPRAIYTRLFLLFPLFLFLVSFFLTHPSLHPYLLATTTHHTTVLPLQATSRCCGPGCRTPSPATESHYDTAYFAWQTTLGRSKARSQDWDAVLQTRPGDVAADLGAGGGHILAALNVSVKYAVEINPVARKSIAENYPGVGIFTYPEELPDDSVDLMFTTSAIEHFECPLVELREMARKVRVGGRIVVGVKNEGVAYATAINKNDVNQHLYTWGRQQLYNLVTKAGFTVTAVDPPVSQMLKEGEKWKSAQDWTHYNTFVYHWARGVKEVAESTVL